MAKLRAGYALVCPLEGEDSWSLLGSHEHYQTNGVRWLNLCMRREKSESKIKMSFRGRTCLKLTRHVHEFVVRQKEPTSASNGGTLLVSKTMKRSSLAWWMESGNAGPLGTLESRKLEMKVWANKRLVTRLTGIKCVSTIWPLALNLDLYYITLYWSPVCAIGPPGVNCSLCRWTIGGSRFYLFLTKGSRDLSGWSSIDSSKSWLV